MEEGAEECAEGRRNERRDVRRDGGVRVGLEECTGDGGGMEECAERCAEGRTSPWGIDGGGAGVEGVRGRMRGEG